MGEEKKKSIGEIDIDEKITVKKDGKKVEEETIIEKVVETPARVLDETVEATKNVEKTVIEKEPVKGVRNFWRTLGPGLTTGAAGDDPSGIATYSQTGAGYGYKFLWLAPFTFPLMAVVQEMCARIGLVTGRGLAANIRKFFPRWVLILCTVLLFIANTFNIGADLGAMSEAIRLFLPQIDYFVLIILIAAVIMLLQIYTRYKKYAKYKKWLALVLLAYIISTFLIKGLNWREIGLSALRPVFGFSKDQILIITGVLGTTISPYLFFWQTSQEVEEEIEDGLTNIQERQKSLYGGEIKKMRIDIWSGMFLSNLVMFFIITACAATLHKNGIFAINSAADAAEALRPLAGDYSYFLFAIGIIGVGALGIPILAGSSSYTFAESFHWKEGLHYKLRQAYSFYGIIIISLVIGVLINLVGIDPMRALVYAAILNGYIAPVILILILILSSSRKLMGSRVNGAWSKIIGGVAILLMAFAGVATIWSLLFR